MLGYLIIVGTTLTGLAHGFARSLINVTSRARFAVVDICERFALNAVERLLDIVHLIGTSSAAARRVAKFPER